MIEFGNVRLKRGCRVENERKLMLNVTGIIMQGTLQQCNLGTANYKETVMKVKVLQKNATENHEQEIRIIS